MRESSWDNYNNIQNAELEEWEVDETLVLQYELRLQDNYGELIFVIFYGMDLVVLLVSPLCKQAKKTIYACLDDCFYCSWEDHIGVSYIVCG